MIDSELKQYLEEFRQEMNARFAQVREETAAEFRQVRQEMASKQAETHRYIGAKAEETKLHFDSTIDRLDRKFDLLGDGIKNLDEKIDREAADIRSEMRQGFADTHALIRFSHAQRPRRAKRTPH